MGVKIYHEQSIRKPEYKLLLPGEGGAVMQTSVCLKQLASLLCPTFNTVVVLPCEYSCHAHNESFYKLRDMGWRVCNRDAVFSERNAYPHQSVAVVFLWTSHLTGF